jgi:dynein heavy chain
MREKVVDLAMRLYKEIKETAEFMPTPVKSHYLFSMRDITKVFESMCRTTNLSFNKDVDIIKLWAHESMRVFMDRLISKDEKDLFVTIL